MTKMIFVNLPVIDLARAKAFYEALGFTNNVQFSDRELGLHGVERDDQRHASHPRQMARLHQPSDPAGNVERSDAGDLLRQP